MSLSLSLSACLPACLFVCRSVGLFVCRFVCLCLPLDCRRAYCSRKQHLHRPLFSSSLTILVAFLCLSVCLSVSRLQKSILLQKTAFAQTTPFKFFNYLSRFSSTRVILSEVPASCLLACQVKAIAGDSDVCYCVDRDRETGRTERFCYCVDRDRETGRTERSDLCYCVDRDRQRQRDRKDRKIRFMLLCRQRQRIQKDQIYVIDRDREDRKIRFILLCRQRQTERQRQRRQKDQIYATV